jgi:hypothetical protein
VSLTEFARLIARWKWVGVPGLVLALAAGATLFSVSSPEYTRTGNYLLLSPVETADGPSNPFLNLGNGVAMTASVLAARVSDAETALTLTERAPDLQYSVLVNASLGAPVLEVTVTDPDPAVVDQTFGALGELLTTELEGMQRDTGAPDVSWVTIRQLTDQPDPTVGYGTPLRNATAGTVGVGLLVMLLVALLERRRRTRAVRTQAQGDQRRATARSRVEDLRRPAPVLPDPGEDHRKSAGPPELSQPEESRGTADAERPPVPSSSGR